MAESFRSAGFSRGRRAVAVGSAGVLCAGLGVVVAGGSARADTPVTTYVTVTGSDGNTCLSVGAACKTVQRALNVAAGFLPGPNAATVVVGPGTFAEAGAGTDAALTITGTGLSSVTITGAGAKLTTIKPAGARRVIAIVGNVPVTLSGMTISGGAPATGATGTTSVAGANGASGGGIVRGTGPGALTLTNVALLNNVAGNGGAGGAGTDRGTGSPTGAVGGDGTDGGAGGNGGAIAFLGTGTLTITGSTIGGSRAGHGGDGGKGGKGGAGKSGGGLLGGSSGAGGNGGVGGDAGFGGVGGAILFTGSTFSATNTTIVTNASGRGAAGGAGGSGGNGHGSHGGGNAALGGEGGDGGLAGGIALAGASTANLTHVTLAANATNGGGLGGVTGTRGTGSPNGITPATPAAGGGQYSVGGIVKGSGAITLTNSLLANSPSNCSGTATASATVATDNSCGTTGIAVDAVNAGKLGALADNGGPTPTSALLTGSSAIGAVPAASCTVNVDQRGKARPGLNTPACAAGAFEPQVPPVAPTLSAVASSATARTAYGWYKDTVTVTFTCTPGSSPLTAPCPSPRVFASSGAAQGGVVTITNGEGLISSVRLTINVDKTKPTISIKGVKSGTTYSGPKQIRCAASDTFSGALNCSMTARGKGIKKNTQVKISYTAVAVDKAGNKTTKKGTYFYKR